jgi:transposase
MQKLQLTKISASQIEALLKGKEEYKIATRLVCMLQIAKGGSSRQAQELLLLSHNQICLWVRRLNKEGIKGLYNKPKPGRKSRISQAQLKELKKLVTTKKPYDYHYNTAIWTAPLIAKWLKQHWNLSYSDDAIYILLKKKLGLSHKKAKGFYPEADKEKRKVFGAAIKKTLLQTKR